MAGYSAEGTIGARIKAARRARHIKSIREFAGLLQGTGLTESVLENIEAGRKSDLPVSELLNIARALRVPPSLLLAPLADSSRELDLPNLSGDLRGMSVAEFDAWLVGDSTGSYRSATADERSDLVELDAFRELQRLRRELARERAVGELEDQTSSNRLEYLNQQTTELAKFLTSAGWIIDSV